MEAGFGLCFMSNMCQCLCARLRNMQSKSIPRIIDCAGVYSMQICMFYVIFHRYSMQFSLIVSSRLNAACSWVSKFGDHLSRCSKSCFLFNFNQRIDWPASLLLVSFGVRNFCYLILHRHSQLADSFSMPFDLLGYFFNFTIEIMSGVWHELFVSWIRSIWL